MLNLISVLMLSKVHIACLSHEHNKKYSLQAVNQNFKGIIGISAAVTSIIYLG